MCKVNWAQIRSRVHSGAAEKSSSPLPSLPIIIFFYLHSISFLLILFSTSQSSSSSSSLTLSLCCCGCRCYRRHHHCCFRVWEDLISKFALLLATLDNAVPKCWGQEGFIKVSERVRILCAIEGLLELWQWAWLWYKLLPFLPPPPPPPPPPPTTTTIIIFIIIITINIITTTIIIVLFGAYQEV